MHRREHPWIVLFVLLLWPLAAGPATADDNRAADPRDPKAIAQQVEQLGAGTFSLRQAAEQELVRLGAAAVAELDRAAAAHASAEVRLRATRALGVIRYRMLAGQFKALARQPEPDLEEVMWAISRLLDPEVKLDDLKKQLDALAGQVRSRLGKDASPAKADPKLVMETIHVVLFVDGGFNGNADDYSNPDNSSLHRVLKSKKGLPIILSHVVIGVGERLGVPIVGVPSRGRFLVKYDGSQAPTGFPSTDIYLQPFEAGRILTPDEVKQELRATPALQLMADTHPHIVTRRMLANIAAHFAATGRRSESDLAEEFRSWFQRGPFEDGEN